MAKLHVYRDASEAVRKAAHRLTHHDRQAMRTFYIDIRQDVHRQQHFRTRLAGQAFIHEDHLAGKAYNALDEIEHFLYRFSEGEPIRSVLRPHAIYYVEQWLAFTELEQESYERDRRLEKRIAHVLGRKKAKRKKKGRKKVMRA